jgi:hypothetical protein
MMDALGGKPGVWGAEVVVERRLVCRGGHGLEQYVGRLVGSGAGAVSAQPELHTDG